jgi:hypothetical protein
MRLSVPSPPPRFNTLRVEVNRRPLRVGDTPLLKHQPMSIGPLLRRIALLPLAMLTPRIVFSNTTASAGVAGPLAPASATGGDESADLTASLRAQPDAAGAPSPNASLAAPPPRPPSARSPLSSP